MPKMMKRKTASQAMTEVNWINSTMYLDIFRKIMMSSTKTKTEIMEIIIFLLKTWYGRVLTMILL